MTKLLYGAFMSKQSKDQQHKQAYTYPSPLQGANKQRRETEMKEVAGRHKNDGQKDHKGAQ